MNNTCITTTVDKNYFCFIPMFIYCARKAYPECEVIVFTRGKYDGEGNKDCVDIGSSVCSDNRYVTAALRFILGDKYLDDYKHVLITDVDLMMTKEEPSFVEQRMDWLEKHSLKCYSNYDVGKQMPGVHFVTRDWWKTTKAARDELLAKIKGNGELLKDDDEKMLYNIVLNSGLPITEKPALWFTHGLHLGKYRSGKKSRNSGESSICEVLIKDPEFIRLVSENRTELLNLVIKNMKLTFGYK